MATWNINVVLLRTSPRSRIIVRPEFVWAHVPASPAAPDKVHWFFHSSDPNFDEAEVEFNPGVNFFPGPANIRTEALDANGHGDFDGTTPGTSLGTFPEKYTIRFRKTSAPTREVEEDPMIIICRP